MARWWRIGGIGVFALTACGALLAGCGSSAQQYACVPTHFQDVSCSVQGMDQPWTLDVDGSQLEAVGMFGCEGTWNANMFTCFTTAGLNAPASGCEFDVTRNTDGSLDTALAETGTSAHCVRQ